MKLKQMLVKSEASTKEKKKTTELIESSLIRHLIIATRAFVLLNLLGTISTLWNRGGYIKERKQKTS